MKSWHLQSMSLLLLVFAYKSNAEETASMCGTIIPGTQACFKVTEDYWSLREQAESDCNKLNGKLASIHSKREQKVAKKYLGEEEEKRINSIYHSPLRGNGMNQVTEHLPFWFGAKSNKTDIYWTDGTKVVYRKLHGKVIYSNKCTQFWNDGSWMFSPCSQKWPLRGLCKIHITTTPRPTTRPQPPTTTPPPSCPISWHLGGNPPSCHFLIGHEHGLDRYETARDCELFGAKLADITSKEEKDFVKGLMVRYNMEEVWVGSTIFQVPTGSSSNGNNLEISGDGKCITMTRGGELKTRQCNDIIGKSVCQKTP